MQVRGKHTKTQGSKRVGGRGGPPLKGSIIFSTPFSPLDEVRRIYRLPPLPPTSQKVGWGLLLEALAHLGCSLQAFCSILTALGSPGQPKWVIWDFSAGGSTDFKARAGWRGARGLTSCGPLWRAVADWGVPYKKISSQSTARSWSQLPDPGCLAALLPCCLAAWLPGCLAAWLPGCLAVV